MNLTSKVVLGGLGAVAGGTWLRRALRKKTSLVGKTAVIIGGSRGFGLDVARVLLAEGCDVAICARDAAELERARLDLCPKGGSASVFARVCDASYEAEVEVFIAAVLSRYKKIDILVTNAATIQVGPLEHMTRADFEDALQQGFWTAYHPTMAVLPHMRRRKEGRIVHVTSMGGRIAVPHLMPYSVAKFAATGFSEGLRAEVAKDGIRVTTILPGLMRTGSHVNVPFKGRFGREFAWFTAGLAGASTSSHRAAMRLVRAIVEDEAEPTMSALVRFATIWKALSPAWFARALALQGALLPSPTGRDPRSVVGSEVAKKSTSRIVHMLDALNRGPVATHNEQPAT